MSQGRTQNQTEATNKLMATFLIAIFVFTIVAYSFSLVETKVVWVKKIQQEFVAKTR